MEPIVYLPVEVKYRELPSRLLIAAHVLNAGYSVVIGNHWAVTHPDNLAVLPQGLFVFKTVNRLQGNIMNMARHNTHAVAATDEEVLVYTETPGYMLAFSENAAQAVELFFAQNEIHRESVESTYPHLKGKVKVVGNARVDLLTPKNRVAFEAHDDRVAPLRPYILFNTNYSSTNSVWGNDHGRLLNIAAATGMFDGEDKEKKFNDYKAFLAWEQGNFRAMSELMLWTIVNVRGLNLVLRPHPAERPEYWQSITKAGAHVHVIPRSDPHPWITAAKLVVHTGCTTGLEAALLDKPALNLQTVDHPISTQIVKTANATVRTVQEAADAITDFLSNRSGPIATHGEKTAAALAGHLPGYRDEAAARLIAEALVENLKGRGVQPKRNYAMKWRGRFTPIERDQFQKDKYMVTGTEMRRAFRHAAETAGLDLKTRLSEITEGLFMVTPA